MRHEFISPKNPVLETGLIDAILHPYLCLLDRVRAEPPGLQQLIAASTMEILGSALAAARSSRDGEAFTAPIRQAIVALE